MREDWDRRAREDYKLHIATGHAATEEAFRASGDKDLDEVILDGIALAREASALEIGCGVGRLLCPLSDRIAAAHGVDISTVMIERSKEFCASHPKVQTHLTDGSLAVFPEGSLDFVYSFIVFQHIPSREAIARYVREAALVLKPGGLLRYQVDGRDRGAHTPDTYDGVTFTPKEARALAVEAGLEIVEDWGAATHYHRITARKTGSEALASLAPHVWDRAFLDDLLSREGVATASPGDVVAGRVPLKDALRPLESRLAKASNEEFVKAAFRALLLREGDAAGVAYHLSILDGGFEDRGALIDTVLTSRDFKELVRPWDVPLPWPVKLRLAEVSRSNRLLDLTEAVASGLSNLSASGAVDRAFRLVLGRRPDDAARAHHESLVAASPLGRRLVVRELLASTEAQRDPGRLSPARVDVLRQLLESSRDEGDEAFLERAYLGVLGRAADPEGRAWHLGRLVSGQTDRSGVLADFVAAAA
ncbi:MAG: DUF4214 domain-containing protein [Acidobacteria bacterium]|nr:DUF4214 domain-containing protein [Acidobacteriota bacterium]